MKTCTKCEESKPFFAFYKAAKMKDGLQSACKVCNDRATTASRYKNPERYTAIATKSQQRLRAEIRNWKLDKKCVRCPENHPACLELHHLDRSQKDFTPSAASSFTRFLEEAAKCEILCANCHRKEHNEY